MSRFFQHDKRPTWGSGRLVKEGSDRLTILFDDGRERTLLKGSPGLVEITDEDVSTDSPVRKETVGEKEERLTKLRPSVLIKSVRLAVRDAIDTAKANGAYPDDVMIDMQKGLSRITADHARFLNTKAAIVRKASVPQARALHEELGIDALFAELADRLEDVEAQEWRWTRAYEEPHEAAEQLRRIQSYMSRAASLEDHEIDELEKLLCPKDRGEPFA